MAGHEHTDFSTSPIWSDVVPLPQDDGPNALVAIAYADEYSEAMSYLRAVMAANEFSDRVLSLTKAVIGMNPASYSVWLYRAKCVFALKKDLREEIKWVNTVALKHQKNYQIWHHRQLMMDKLGDPSGEGEFIAKMFEQDAKNYHVWSYRQWMVRRFDLWDSVEELDATRDLLRLDVRNNSAWNHRFFLVFGRENKEGGKMKEKVVEREIEFAKAAVWEAPQNGSSWNYLKGVLRKVGRPLAEIEEFAKQFVLLDKEDGIKSSHALDVLAEIWVENDSKKEDAKKALDMLAEKYDPIRANYWRYRKGLISTSPTGETVMAS